MDIQTVLNRLPNNHPLIKSKLVYEVVLFINEKRKLILNDLIAYSNDPVRHKRRMRILIQLCTYEQQILSKLDNFDFDNENVQIVANDISWEVSQIVNINS
jgi:hypothetical protein